MPLASFLFPKALYNRTMIRKASVNDLIDIQELCRSDSSRLLFIDGDIEQNGLETPYQETWIETDQEGLRGIFLRYHTNLVFYFKKPCLDELGFEALFDEHIKMISACKEHIEMMPSLVKDRFNFRSMYFCECEALVPQNISVETKKASSKDVEGIIDSMSQISEFKASNVHESLEERIQSLKERYELGKVHGFILKENDKVIAHASSGVETKSAIMVGGVYTLPEYRGKGYGRAVVTALTEYALKQGQKPCLFYDNPKAGKIYHDLGYKTFDMWCLGSLKP
jgi:predicted GNAT family acetyltransferase